MPSARRENIADESKQKIDFDVNLD